MNWLSPDALNVTSKFSPQQIPARARYRLRSQAKLGIALLNLGFLLCSGAAMTQKALSAERIYINYGPLQFTLPIEDLELYAKEGKIGGDLANYAGYLKPDQLAQLRQVLQTKADVSPVAIAQFLYSPQGETILRRVGEVIQTKSGQSGFYAIRAALIQAAADKNEGLTPLNVLRKFPTYGIRINSQRGFDIIDELSNTIRQTGQAIGAVEQQALSELAAQNPSDGVRLMSLFRPTAGADQVVVGDRLMRDLRKPGPLNWDKETFTVNNIARNRSFPVDVYLPQLSGRDAQVIVISHGLGNNRETFVYLAQHLASYGFAVAVPEHPGSNADRLQEVISGFAREPAPPREFIDRPLDVKDLLNELQRIYRGRLNLQKVGAIGQSFGGYTALAVAGAKLNFEQIQKDCQLSNDSLNVSLLLQCRALLVPPTDYNLQDERIKAAIAINPISSTVFGQPGMSDIKVPLMLVASSADTVTPALPEQIQPFKWVTEPNKYLALFKEGTHFSTLARSPKDIPLPEGALGPDQRIAFDYVKALSLAFFQTYIAGNPEYQPYLSASYANSISQYAMPLNLIQSLTDIKKKQERANSTPPPIPSRIPPR